jgi:predicted small integral membrane protein
VSTLPTSSTCIRFAKWLLVATSALFISLVVFNNVTDYESNLQYVEHVLTMDTTFPNNKGMWRRIDSEGFHHVAYVLIIVIEAAVALLLWAGVVQLWRSRVNAPAFNRAKGAAVLGLAGAIALFFGGFLAVGGEWFLMWQSETWNAQPESAMFATLYGLILIFLTQRDADDV